MRVQEDLRTADSLGNESRMAQPIVLDVVLMQNN